MENSIIAISREYGSGGRDVGRLLAGELGLPVFDKEIMHKVVEESGIPADFIEKNSEGISSKFFHTLKRLSLNVPSIRIPLTGFNSHVMATTVPTERDLEEDRLFQTQSSLIKNIATQHGGCVIVGRCAGYILRDYPNLLSVFIRGDFDDRIQRTVETYNMPEKDAAKNVIRIDKHRANHYSLYTKQQWGAAKNYDLVINTSYTGLPGAVAVIKAMLNTKK